MPFEALNLFVVHRSNERRRVVWTRRGFLTKNCEAKKLSASFITYPTKTWSAAFPLPNLPEWGTNPINVANRFLRHCDVAGLSCVLLRLRSNLRYHSGLALMNLGSLGHKKRSTHWGTSLSFFRFC
jgi:hypothetical protein